MDNGLILGGEYDGPNLEAYLGPWTENADDELIRIYDKKNRYQGYMLPKKLAHDLEKWHRVIAVVLARYRNSLLEIMLQKRGKNVSLYKERWDLSITGHIRWNETEREAAKREGSEETTLIIDEKKLLPLFSLPYEFQKGKKLIRHHVQYLLYVLDPTEVVLPNQDVEELTLRSRGGLLEALSSREEDFVPFHKFHTDHRDDLYDTIEDVLNPKQICIPPEPKILTSVA